MPRPLYSKMDAQKSDAQKCASDEPRAVVVLTVISLQLLAQRGTLEAPRVPQRPAPAAGVPRVLRRVVRGVRRRQHLRGELDHRLGLRRRRELLQEPRVQDLQVVLSQSRVYTILVE